MALWGFMVWYLLITAGRKTTASTTHKDTVAVIGKTSFSSVLLVKIENQQSFTYIS